MEGECFVSNWSMIGGLLLASSVFIALFAIVTIRKEGGRKRASTALDSLLNQKANKRRLNLLFQVSYVHLIRVPIIKLYIRNIRKRLEILHAHDEYTIRRETMRITYLAIGVTAVAVVLLTVLSGTLLSFLWILLGMVVANGILIDTFVNKAEDRLLKQSIIFYEDVRHHYQQTKNVEEAIYEASQTCPHEAGKHAERIYDVLTAENQSEALETYYEIAPNRYYRLFAGISYLISEYGDRYVKNGSMFLNAVARLVQEINYEILRRDKLNYLLKGLAAICIAPVLVLQPLEDWAREYFPIMSDFYTSKFGLIIKVVFFAVVLICYLIIRKMLEHDEARYMAKSKRLNWEKWLYERKLVRWGINRIKPQPHKRLHFKLTMLLKQANSPLTLEWLYVQRAFISILCFVITLGLCLYMHASAVQNTLYNPMQGMGMFGALSPADTLKAEETTEFDRALIEELQSEQEVTKGTVIQMVSRETNVDGNDSAVIKTAQRILDKYNLVQSEYLKWWELLIGIAISVVAFQSPIWLLQFQKRMRQIEMQNEVDQFHTIISILAEFERMSVETIMEWMERFAIIFQEQIKNGLNNYSGGAIEALETMKQEAPFVSFVRIIEKLQLAVEKIPVKDAFDDLEMAREYYMEKRKEHNSRVIDQKAAYGKVIGFIPFSYIVFLDLVAPMLYLSVAQMGQSMRDISGI